MAVVGRRGTFATVQAPSVDFGAMTERAVDKQLAREDARRKEAEAKKLTQAKDVDAAKKARAEEIKGDIKAAKLTGRSSVDISNRRFVDQARDAAYQAKKKYIETGDPKYKKEFDDQVYQVENLANSIDSMNTLLTNVSENYDQYNSKFMPEFEKLFTGVNKGNVNVSTKDGQMMVTTYDLDPNGDVVDIKTQSITDILQEPIKASNYEAVKKDFMALNQPDDITDVTGSTTTRKKEVTARLEGRIDVFADKLSKDPNEFADWYASNYGVDEYNKNKGNFKQEDFDNFKKDIKEDIKESYPIFEDVSRVQPRTTPKKTGTPPKVVKPTNNKPSTLGIERTYEVTEGGEPVTLSKDAKYFNFKLYDKGQYKNIESTSGEKAITLETVYYDNGKIYAKVSEIETDRTSGSISGQSGNQNVRGSIGASKKERNTYLITENEIDRLNNMLGLIGYTKEDIVNLFEGNNTSNTNNISGISTPGANSRG